MIAKNIVKKIYDYFLSISSKKIIISLLILLILSLASSLYIFGQYKKLLKNADNIGQAESAMILNKLSKIIELPKDEIPQLADIIDIDKLKGDPFFSESKNGDKIIIYSKAKKAIIYRLEENKIINVGPIAGQPQN